jgi:hypothetical protein
MKTSSLPLIIFVLAGLILGVGGQAAAQRTLTVTKDGTGTGLVTSSPPGIRCGTDCTETITKEGRRFVLTARPASTSYFAGWAGTCAGTLKTCAVTMTADAAVTATFSLKEAAMGFSSDSIDFGTVEMGEKVTQIFKVSNSGTGDLYVTLSGLENSDFSFVGRSNAKIRPKGSFGFKIKYKPSADALSDSGINENEPSGAKEKPKIIILQVTSNDPNKPSVEVPVLADLVPKTGYDLKVESNVTFNVPTKVNITYKQKGEIPFNLIEHSQAGFEATKYVDCTPGGDNPDPQNWICKGSTTYSATGTLTGTEGKCTVNGSGMYFYEMTGFVAGNLFAELTITEVSGGWTMCCPGGCGLAPDYMAGVFHQGSKFNVEIPVKPAAKVTKTVGPLYPNDPYSGSIIWSVIFK